MQCNYRQQTDKQYHTHVQFWVSCQAHCFLSEARKAPHRNKYVHVIVSTEQTLDTSKA